LQDDPGQHGLARQWNASTRERGRMAKNWKEKTVERNLRLETSYIYPYTAEVILNTKMRHDNN
jgi:hypothetical protein